MGQLDPEAAVSAQSQLRSALPFLSESERRVALWVLDHAAEVLRQSMSFIAQETQVSDTTVLRMCRTAGFDGFTDLKLALAREPHIGEPLASADSTDAGGDFQAARGVFQANMRALSDTLNVLDVVALGSAIELMGTARHILVGGVGGSGVVAQALYQRCFRLGLRCDAPHDAQLQLMHASLLGPGDLVIAISYSGITSDAVLLLQEARARGASTLCITGNQRSPLARLAQVTLVSVSREQRSEPMAAQVAQLTLVDALYAAYAGRNASAAQLNEERMVKAILPKSVETESR